MIVRVDPQKSVCDGGIWYNQGDIFEPKDYESIKDSVTVIGQESQPKITNDEEDFQ